MKKTIFKVATILKLSLIPTLLNGDSIPSYVDTSKAKVEQLNKDLAAEDSLMNLLETDSLFLDSLVQSGANLSCGMDGQMIFDSHTHSGRWEDENGNEWPWFNSFKNDTICPICNLKYDELEIDENGYPILPLE